MTYRKTWFSYVLWLLYSILCVALLMYAGRVWTYYFAGVPYMKNFPDSLTAPLAGLSEGLLTLIGLLTIPLMIALYWMIRGIAERIRKKCVWRESVITRFECIIVLIIMAGGIFLRVESARYDILMAERGLTVENESMIEDEMLSAAKTQSMMYYNRAVVTQERSAALPAIICYSIRELYVICLSFVLSFLGNKIASAVIMQIVLQILGMILAYAVTRNLAGRIPACVVLFYLACAPSCLEMLTLFNPVWLFFDLYMIGMLIAAGYVKGYCADRLNRFAAIAGAVVIGVIIGVLAYLDIIAVTLLIVMSAVFTGKKRRREDKPIHNSAIISVSVFLVTLIVGVLVRGLMIGAVYGNGGMDMLRNIVSQWTDLTHLQGAAFTVEYPYIQDIYLMGIPVILAAFLAIDFFRSGKEQNYMLWILICILVTPTPMAVIGTGHFGLLSLYIWSVLAGLGLQNCIFGGGAKIMQAKIEEINAEAFIGESEADAATGKVNHEEMMEKVDTEVKWAELYEEDEKQKNVGQIELNEESEKDVQTEEMQKPRYFENPLPLPKKHVKKEMDYQYTVEEKDMKYDVEVSEDDDFDIQ